MARQSYPSIEATPPPQDSDGFWEYVRRLAAVTRSLRLGKHNAVGDVTLTASSTTTTLTHECIGPNSHINFTPLTANASVVLNDGAFYISARADGSATITHTSDANTDLDLTYEVVG